MLPIFAPVRCGILGIVTVGLLMGCGSGPPTGESAESSSEPSATESTDTVETPAGATADGPPAAATPTATDAPSADSVTVTDAATPLTPESLWQQLRQPGDALYVVLLRHAIAPGTGDPANFQLDDCSTQRNLSDAGRSQAAQIGQAFRDRGVEVQQVLSSQWCRCLETAELMALGEVEPKPALNSFFRDRRTAAAQTAEVKQYLLSQADNPGVTVMVTHQVNITELTEIFPRSGEAVVLQVEDDSITQIGQLMPGS